MHANQSTTPKPILTYADILASFKVFNVKPGKIRMMLLTHQNAKGTPMVRWIGEFYTMQQPGYHPSVLKSGKFAKHLETMIRKELHNCDDYVDTLRLEYIPQDSASRFEGD